MIMPEVRRIITGLIAKTKDDQVNWYPADDLGLPTSTTYPDDYAVSLPEASLNIRRDPQDGEVVFQILDSKGAVGYRVSILPDREDYSLFEDLLEAAKFRARGVVATLQYLKDILETDEVIGAVAPEEEELPF